MADQTRLDRKLNGWLNRYFTVTAWVLKIHFGIKFCYRLFDQFAISYFSYFQELLHHPVQDHCKVHWKINDWNLKTVWQKFIETEKSIMKYQNCFFNARWCSCFCCFSKLLTFRNFCDQKLLKGNLLKKTRQTWFKIQTVVQIIWKQTRFLRSVYIASKADFTVGFIVIYR